MIAFAIGRLGVSELRRIFYKLLPFSKSPKLPTAKAIKKDPKSYYE